MVTTFKVGDLVTYGKSGKLLTITRLWYESFPAFKEPQQVARLTGARNDFSMRTAHLALFDTA